MTDDPFERAVRRAERAERADKVDEVRTQAVQVHRDVHRAVAKPLRDVSATLFRVHSFVFLGVNLLLFAIWVTVTPTATPWFLFVFLGWGIGLLAHYAAVKDHLPKRR